MNKSEFSKLEHEVIRAGHELAKERGAPVRKVFGGDSLSDDVARLQVARRVRKRFQATSQQIESAIEECLTP